MIELSRLILENNYVEASIGIFKLQNCLPMGMPASPVGLDIVCISSELKRFQIDTFNVKTPFCLTPWCLPSNNNHILSYLRYQDDSKVVACSPKPEDLKNIVLNFGCLFPPQIPMNIALFHIYGSFLDVVFLRKLSSNKIETFPKKKLMFPVTFINSKSMTPNCFKFGTLYSKLLRIRRLCSQTNYVSIFDELLKNEFISVGYKSLSKKIKKYTSLIKERFDENLQKIASPSKNQLKA